MSTQARRIFITAAFSGIGLALRALPAWLHDRLAARAPRKPRYLSL